MPVIAHLPPKERIERYRALADQARLKARQCTGKMQDAFIRIAEQWEELAREFENSPQG